MEALRFTRYALSVSVVAVLLSACGGGGSSPLAPAPGIVNPGIESLTKSRTFHYSGNYQVFRVPSGVKSVTIVARGAKGGGEKGGRGGRVYAKIPVFSSERLYVFVGGHGIHSHGGFNGGGEGGVLYGFAYGGGGASDIRDGGLGLQNRIIVAGGGGGEGQAPYSNDAAPAYYYAATGGKGGTSTGGAGEVGWPGAYSGYYPGGGGGDGGSQVKGGAGGYGGEGVLGNGNPGDNGSDGRGGKGGAGCYYSTSCFVGQNGGGGGGGYYGGGGGGAGGANSTLGFGGGGGGGGSSYIEPKATKYQSWQGWKNAIGDGLVVISWK